MVYRAQHGWQNQARWKSVMDLHKDLFDAASLALVIGTLAEWLPPIAAAISIVWTCIRIHDWWRNRSR